MNVLVTSTTFIPSVILCGHSQLDYLEKQGKLNYRFVISHFTNVEDVNWADIIVFLRSDSDLDAYISDVARKANKHLVYVMDDDLLNVPSYLSSAPYYSLKSTKNNIKRIMANCHTFLTTSPVLLEKYGRNFKKVFLIDEPSLNTIEKKNDNKKIKIGFAGSIDRAQDIQDILKTAITKIKSEFKDEIEIEFMGAKPDFVDQLGLTHLPYQDGYDAYTAFMSRCNWDIGLAPMPKTDFHRCKYINKFIEYSSFGIVGIYSNVEPYTYGVVNEENGLLVNNTTDEWFDAISKLIKDNELRKSISNECLKQAKNKYSLDKLSQDYLNKITSDYKKENHKEIGDFTLIKMIIFVKRVYRKIVEQGFNFPKWLSNKLKSKIDEKTFQKNNKEFFEVIKKNASSEKTMCVIAPYFDNRIDDYSNRVRFIDSYYDEYTKIYLTGENRLCEEVEITKIDDKHILIDFNSYDKEQCEKILELIKQSQNCLIHSVIRFLREKISNDMFKLFDIEGLNIIWDTHGNVPEQYHEQKNYHIEMITNDIEKEFYEKSTYALCENTQVKDKLVKKYGDPIITFCIISE